MKSPSARISLLSLAAATLLSMATIGTAAANDKPDAKPFDVKGMFRNVCGFCHEDYGRKEGKGPKLMNSERTDQQLFDRIKNGKPGRMAAFGGVFTDDQIWQMVKFTRNLKADEEPKNP